MASVGKGNATLYAFDKGGRALWKKAVGPPMVTTGWAHAVGVSSLLAFIVLVFPTALPPEVLGERNGRR